MRNGISYLALAAVLALAGCGSSKSSSSGSSSTGSTPAVTSTASSQSKPEQFRQVLMERSNFTAAQADCIVNTVLKKIGRPEFDRLYGKGNTPKRVQEIIGNASIKCAPRGAGQ